jgi:Tfp pilus assembly protein PilF
MPLSVVLLAVGLVAPPQKPAPPAAGLKTEDTTPVATPAALEAGLKAFHRRRYAAAEIEFRKAVEADPSNAAAHFYLGYTYYKLGEPSRRMNENKEKARTEFARCFELDPRFRPDFGRKRK